jgi:hypothetical protein
VVVVDAIFARLFGHEGADDDMTAAVCPKE